MRVAITEKSEPAPLLQNLKGRQHKKLECLAISKSRPCASTMCHADVVMEPNEVEVGIRADLEFGGGGRNGIPDSADRSL
jgi:hypothetical protein